VDAAHDLLSLPSNGLDHAPPVCIPP
jgi:hypothetical protein